VYCVLSHAADASLLEHLNPGVSLGVLNYVSLEVVEAPDEYGRIPLHPTDGPWVKNRDVELEGQDAAVGAFALGVDFSPFPFPILDLIRVGYRATFTFNGVSEEPREGLSNMEWSQNVYAGTYSRIAIPGRIDSFEASAIVPIRIQETGYLTIRPGISYDFADSAIEGGWDRHYKERAYMRKRLDLEGENLFIEVGFCRLIRDRDMSQLKYSSRVFERYEPKHLMNRSMGFYAFWKKNKLEDGDVRLGGQTFGLGFRGAF